LLGVVPAIGAAVIPWLVYAYVSASTREPKQFGKGDIRGVIAVEASNNATVGGALLPTLTFGIPGSAPMALILGGLLLHGIAPGPEMLRGKIDFTYTMIATIVIANILGGALAFGLARWLAQLVFVRSSILVPIMLSIVMIGAVQSSRSWGDVLGVILIGVLGWVMKRARWSRAPFFLAFILAPLVDRYFHISMNIYGWSWAARPFVWPILVASALFVAGVLLRRFLVAQRKHPLSARKVFKLSPRIDTDMFFSAMALFVTIAAFITTLDWPLRAAILPQIVAVLGILCSGFALAGCFVRRQVIVEGADDASNFDIETDFGTMHASTVLRRAGLHLCALCLLGVAGWLVGLPLALAAFIFVIALAMGERPVWAATLAICASVAGWMLFDQLLKLSWPSPIFHLING
jgi:hypothetical protein